MVRLASGFIATSLRALRAFGLSGASPDDESRRRQMNMKSETPVIRTVAEQHVGIEGAQRAIFSALTLYRC
jgi:hypothetical protein